MLEDTLERTIEPPGTLSHAAPVQKPCQSCRKPAVHVQSWTSDQGGSEAYRFTCRACSYVWWVGRDGTH